jgi:hypothetical protein
MSNTVTQLGRQLAADRKKLSIMLALLVFGMLLWGRLLLKEVPRSVTAMPTVATNVHTPSATDGVAAVAPGFQRVVYVDWPGVLDRDLFTFDPNPYKRNPDNPSTALGQKSPPQPCDEARRKALTLEARATLTLNSVVTQPRPYAVINEQLLIPGQSIEDYTLRKISDLSVILEKQGITILLRM